VSTPWQAFVVMAVGAVLFCISLIVYLNHEMLREILGDRPQPGGKVDTTDPTTISMDAVRAAFISLGIDYEHVTYVAVDRMSRSITVTRLRVDEEGRPFKAGDGVATVTTVIGIDYQEVEET
jgi:hypothetical protein